VGTTLAAAGVAAALGVGGGAAWLVGLVVALSSTALVLKLYGDRGELDSLHGKVVLGVLLFQDLFVVPAMVLLPAIGGDRPVRIAALALRFGAGVALVVAAFVVGRRLLPRLLAAAARGRSREAFLLAAVALCLGTAWATERLGLSAALGAFLGGLLLADSDYAHQALADVMPLREVFASVFFVSVGMLVDLDFVAGSPGLLIAAVAAVVVLKAAIATAAVAALGLPGRTAAVAGIGLAQIGELSFVLLELGRQQRLIDFALYQLLLATAAVSMLITPALIALAPVAAARLSRLLPPPPPPPAPAARAQVLIVGYGANGEILARILRESGIRYAIVDADAGRVRSAVAAGEPAVFGDATRPEILRHAGVEGARIVVLAISDVRAVAAAVAQVRALAPGAQILARTRRLREAEPVLRAGADRVVAEEYESAIEIYTWVLDQLHVPRNVIAAHTRVLRGEDYRLLRGEAATPAGISRAVADALAGGTTDVFRVTEGTAAAGRDLRELDLRQRTGATVLAVVREDRPLVPPPSDLRLLPGDALVLVGAHAQIEDAFALLEREA
jgi:CPA2 family monovalent cation:H+ antiporter-2